MKKLTKKRVYFLLFCFILCFIWGNSLLSREISGAISHFFADALKGGGGTSEGEHYLLRKAAHFTEFAFLAAVFFLLAKEVWRDNALRLTLVALVGVAVPLIDETIQIFSNRGPALRDVWLDISGYAAGCLVAFLVCFFIARRAGKRNDRADL